MSGTRWVFDLDSADLRNGGSWCTLFRSSTSLQPSPLPPCTSSVHLCNLADRYRLQIPNKRLRPLIRLGLVGMVAANLAVTGASTFLSIHNYPGGEVWRVLEDLRKGSLDNGQCIILAGADKKQ